MNFNLEPFYKRVEKPWGFEIIYTPNELERTGKILFVLAGKKLSLQYHDQKEETLCLLSGEGFLWLEDSEGIIHKLPMEQHKGYTIVPPQKHRVEAVSDIWFLEVSTPEIGNTFRLDDDYQRPTETEDVRKKENRGWSKK